MLRRLSRLWQRASAYFSPPSRFDAPGATVGLPSSAVRHGRNLAATHRADRRRFFTPLRVEWLERREVLTGITIDADASSYVEGQTAWFTFTLSQPAPVAFSIDLLLSGGPAGSMGYVMPIAQGQTTAHVDFPTADNSTPSDSYTLNLAITGSSEEGGPVGPFNSASTNILDDDYSSGGGGSGPSGPTGPVSVTLNQPADANEGTPFEVTGTISPAGYYSFD